MDAVTEVPTPVNEPVHDYAPSSPERARLVTALAELDDDPIDLPHVIGGMHRMGGGERIEVVQPHRHSAKLGTLTNAEHSDATAAIDAAMAAKEGWANTPFDERAAVFLRAADLLAGPWRAKLCAATMLGQSKSAYQAEIDAACELIDFWRFNVGFAREIMAEQPINTRGVWNRTDYRPLEGFVYAITPFNFTAIAGNLPTAAALMGNTVVWKPSPTQTFAAYLTMQLLEAAGFPMWRSPIRGWRASTSPAPPRRSSTCGGRSAPTSTAITPTRDWSARPAERISCWLIRRRGPTCCAPP
jgi:1-pyrroline-5-carboxylate dehydrogenase